MRVHYVLAVTAMGLAMCKASDYGGTADHMHLPRLPQARLLNAPTAVSAMDQVPDAGTWSLKKVIKKGKQTHKRSIAPAYRGPLSTLKGNENCRVMLDAEKVVPFRDWGSLTPTLKEAWKENLCSYQLDTLERRFHTVTIQPAKQPSALTLMNLEAQKQDFTRPHFQQVLVLALPARRQRMKEVLYGLGVQNAIFFDAYPQQDMGLSKLDLERSGVLGKNCDLSNKQLATYHGHMAIWRKCAEDFSSCLVLEDTIRKSSMEDEAAHRLQIATRFSRAMQHMPKDWQVINFGRCKDSCSADKAAYWQGNDEESAIVKSQQPLCGHAYGLTQAAAKRLVDQNGVIVAPVDHVLASATSYSVTPRIFEQSTKDPIIKHTSFGKHFLPECGVKKEDLLAKRFCDLPAATGYDDVKPESVGSVSFEKLAKLEVQNLEYDSKNHKKHKRKIKTPADMDAPTLLQRNNFAGMWKTGQLGSDLLHVNDGY